MIEFDSPKLKNSFSKTCLMKFLPTQLVPNAEMIYKESPVSSRRKCNCL